MIQTKILWYMVIAVLLCGCKVDKVSVVFIEYRQSGGIIGLDDRLTIEPNGDAVLQRKTGKTEFKLDSDTIRRLETLLNNAGFTKLKRAYLPAQQGGDLIEYIITYNGYTVRMKDTAIPDILQPAIGLLNEIVENGGTR